MAKLPKLAAYAGVSLLPLYKCLKPITLYNHMQFTSGSLAIIIYQIEIKGNLILSFGVHVFEHYITKGTILTQVYLLKSLPLRMYVNFVCFSGISFSTSLDWTNVRISSHTD